MTLESFASLMSPLEESLNKAVSQKVIWTPYMKDGNKIVSYAYLEQHNPELRDGVRHSEPLYKATFTSPYKEGKLETLKDPAVLIFEIQGVRPLTLEETKLMEKVKGSWVNASFEILKSNKEFSQRDKSLFCLWVNTHGVIAGHLKKAHGNFFKLLGCF